MEELKGGTGSNQLQVFPTARFFEAVRDLSLAKDSNDLLERLLKKIEDFFAPELAALLLRDQASHDLSYARIVGEKPDKLQDKIIKRGEGICGLAAETNQNIIISDCARDPRFNPKVDHLPGLEVYSLMAVPLRQEKKVFGLVALFNKKNRRQFNLDEFKLLLSLLTLSEMLLERMVLLKHISELEEFDPLTETYNTRAFVNYFQREVARCERYGIDLSLLRVDVDYYEKIIQTFGQEAGERVVSNLSFILRKTTRRVDLVARIGEYEFMIMLPNTNRAGALKLRERIMKILESQNLRATGIPYTVTIEVYSESGQTVSALSKVSEISTCLNQVNRKQTRRKYPTPGEELEENILSALFSGPK
ncbi:MAG: diguanylate cyclase [Candidatus Saccharicenans sp.]|uniref:diguanylate cyclase n=1 Tax=Candidatus Saccharicenans sp. TaxID=2819258 RepID=UPI004049738C